MFTSSNSDLVILQTGEMVLVSNTREKLLLTGVLVAVRHDSTGMVLPPTEVGERHWLLLEERCIGDSERWRFLLGIPAGITRSIGFSHLVIFGCEDLGLVGRKEEQKVDFFT